MRKSERLALQTLIAMLFGLVGGVVYASPGEDGYMDSMPAMLPVAEWRDRMSIASITTAADFLARQRDQAAVTTVTPSSTTPGYVPKTKDDNTPWRFDMNQNGRRMTAEEFDAWMKAKGIRVATGKPAGEAAVAQPATCTPTAEAAC